MAKAVDAKHFRRVPPESCLLIADIRSAGLAASASRNILDTQSINPTAETGHEFGEGPSGLPR